MTHKSCQKIFVALKSSFLKEHVQLILIVLCYVFAGFCIQSIFEIDEMMHLKFSYRLLNISAVLFGAVFFIIQIILGKIRRYYNIKTVLGLLVVIALAAPFMSTFSSFKQVIPVMQDFVWDYWFMKLDYVLHFGNHPWNIVGFVYDYPGIVRAFDSLYILWFPVLLLMCLWMAISSRRRLRTQFFVTACLAWILLGTVMAIFFSSAGPCYYAKVVDTAPNPYEPLMTHLMKMHESMPLFAVQNQIGLWDAQRAHVWLPFGGVSAMPSLHVAIAVLIAIVGWRINKCLGILFSAYAIVIQIGSFILGWHYAVDGYVSIILTVLLWNAVEKYFLLINISPRPINNSHRNAKNFSVEDLPWGSRTAGSRGFGNLTNSNGSKNN